jgi:hypothetical protein
MRTYLRKKFLLASECVAAAAMVLAPPDGCAQTAGKPMAFDAASIRKNVDNIGRCSPDQVQATPSGFHMTNCPLNVAVGAAYVPTRGEALGYLVEDRIVGMPDWLTQERYDIYARIAHSDAEAWRDPARQKEMLRAMMQTLLAERCKLVVHREMKNKPIYALVTIPGGSGFFVRGQGSIDIYGATTGTLTLLLSGPAGRPIVDKTGLTGHYDMHLDMGQPGPPAADGSADPGASIFSVVQEQLGLKLESQKDEVETLVIDHVERPSAN